MVKLLIILGVLGLVVASCFILCENVNENKKVSSDNEDIYYGPVPLCSDEDYFRKTGITIMEANC